MMPLWLFALVGTLTVISAFGVILQENPVHCALALVMTLLLVGVLFMGLGAVTVGFLQIIVYAGAIMVLFLFVIWLLNLQAEPNAAKSHLALKFFGSLGASVLVAEIWTLLARTPMHAPPAHLPAGYGSMQALVASLFSKHLIAFEVTGMLLLVAVIGAVALGRRLGPERAAGGTRQTAEPGRRASA